ncbi:hypothetical protein [Tautonia rosea]|uniref:hypothetical protein n=1 Tax=Tautonia rosea TaxID=2728037 RepID=UPI001474D0F5|nr:hypothetical protein [Tautonia rosea]
MPAASIDDIGFWVNLDLARVRIDFKCPNHTPIAGGACTFCVVTVLEVWDEDSQTWVVPDDAPDDPDDPEEGPVAWRTASVPCEAMPGIDNDNVYFDTEMPPNPGGRLFKYTATIYEGNCPDQGPLPPFWIDQKNKTSRVF